MAEITCRQALHDTLREELQRNENVFSASSNGQWRTRLRVDPQIVAQHCHDFIYEGI